MTLCFRLHISKNTVADVKKTILDSALLLYRVAQVKPTPQTHKNGKKHGRRIVEQIGKLRKFAAIDELSVCTGFIAQGA